MQEAYELADRNDTEGYNSVKVMCGDVQRLIQREWVGLTDEDKEECLAKWAELGWWGVVDVIEAKLREKNGG